MQPAGWSQLSVRLPEQRSWGLTQPQTESETLYRVSRSLLAGSSGSKRAESPFSVSKFRLAGENIYGTTFLGIVTLLKICYMYSWALQIFPPPRARRCFSLSPSVCCHKGGTPQALYACCFSQPHRLVGSWFSPDQCLFRQTLPQVNICRR